MKVNLFFCVTFASDKELSYFANIVHHKEIQCFELRN